jgi:hypothetical protein
VCRRHAYGAEREVNVLGPLAGPPEQPSQEGPHRDQAGALWCPIARPHPAQAIFWPVGAILSVAFRAGGARLIAAAAAAASTSATSS